MALAGYAYVALWAGAYVPQGQNKRLVFLFPPWTREAAAEVAQAALDDWWQHRLHSSSVYFELYSPFGVERRMYCTDYEYHGRFTPIARARRKFGFLSIKQAVEVPDLIRKGIPKGLAMTPEEQREWTVGGRLRRVTPEKLAELIELRKRDKEKRLGRSTTTEAPGAPTLGTPGSLPRHVATTEGSQAHRTVELRDGRGRGEGVPGPQRHEPAAVEASSEDGEDEEDGVGG